MFVGQFVDEGLGNAAHIFGSKESKVAAIVDPLRDVDGYLATAEHHGLEIRYVFDTHLHNDFVSGAREIAAKTGARVVAGADAGLAFDHTPLADGESLSMGDLKVTALATPGHTPEHMAYAVAPDGPGGPSMVFTGGALIVGGVARTDLLGKENSVPFAKQLYHSLREKLMTLPDAVSVFPTHGAGSFCAAPATAERQTTIGRERVANPLVLARSEEDFVRRALEGLPSYPVYFGSLRPVNQKGPKILGGLPQPPAIPPATVKELAAEGASILDVRPPPLFLRAHIPGAYGISAHAPLTTWAGWLIPVGTPLILVSHGPRDLESAVRQLIRIGFDDLRGTVGGGMAAWESAGLPVERIPLVAPWDLASMLASVNPPVVLDVRQDDEWADGHIPGAVHIENGRLPWDDLPFAKDRPVVVHCHTGNRSASGVSVLLRRGYSKAQLLDGGWAVWSASGLPMEPG
ncbi:MAG TPA: rhodanese-like domain-containing protein [Thermoplasmata archaeon]|nr:rhodanese-like domain-containing protein [Thermoplasmata archaeon]